MGNDLLADAAIQQLNLGYDAEQDRLLLKIGLSDDSEITVWLTRRVVKSLWNLLQQAGVPSIAMTEAFGDQLPSESGAKKSGTQTSPQVNYSDAYQSRHIARLNEPMLAHDCNLATSPDAPASLELKSKSGALMKIVLSGELTQALGHMLQLATKEAAWDIGFATSRIVMKETSTRPVLH